MTCNKCGEKPKKGCGAFPKAVIEIDNPEKIVLLRKVLVPASIGDESTFPPAIGKYHNVLLEYEASGGIYLYSSDGIPTKLSSDVTELQAQLNALRVRIGEEEVARADADTALSGRITSLDDSLATVARTGSYNDLSDKPTIGDGTLTIKKNGSNVGTFTANATANTDVNIVVPTKTSDLANDGSDGASQYVESNDLATVATSGSYNDLTNKPTIGNATLTIKRNNANAGTFTANATTNKSINIAVPTKTSDLTNDGADGASTYVETRNLPTVGNATLTITENNTSVGTFTANATSNKTINITSPTKTSDLTNDGADGTSTYVEADDLPTVDTTYSSSSNNAIANSTVTNSLDRNVMTNLAVDSTPSTTTVNLNNTKTNLAYPSSSTTSSISLPVASSTQAGVMNSATFDAVTSNTNNINAILNGAVAISNLPASPTQAQLTTAWENETGLTSLINRASVYDVTNNKVWAYYTNDQTWHAASNTSQVTVNTFTNSSGGTIKGSTNDGQVFAESDGTGSVNGWDTLTSAVSSNTSKLATIAQGAEVNVQANWTQTNTSADDYIKNKPANLVQDANYVHTDNNFTTALKDKLNGISAGAEVNVQSDWSQTNTSADDYIKNKPANLVQDASYVHTDNNFTTTLKNKLDGIESGAEVNVQADWSQTDTSADDYIKNKPTIPTVNNATLTIQKNGANVQTFTANSSTNKTANITVPTAVSELTNDANYATTTQLNNGLATKQDTLTAGNNIQINGNTISATDTTYTAGNAIDIANGEISADIYPADFFTAGSTIENCGSDEDIDGTILAPLKSVEVKGDTFQQTYSGAQLLTKNGMATPYTDSDYWSLTAGASNTDLGDGWGRWAHTGTTTWVNVMPQMSAAISGGTYKPSTVYTILFEWKNVDNFDRLTISQPGNALDPFDGEEATVGISLSQTSGTSKIALTTRSTLTNDMRAVRLFFTKHTASSDASIDIRVTIVEGDYSSSDLQWQPYVGGIASPSPDYPQDVQVVAGEQTVTMTGKNLFDSSASAGQTYRANYSQIDTNSFAITSTETTGGTAYVRLDYTLQPTQTYTISWEKEVISGSPTSVAGSLAPQIGTSGSIPSPAQSPLTVTTDSSGVLRLYYYLGYAGSGTTTLGDSIKIYNVQLEKGSTATTYEPYQSQSYTVDLGPDELYKIGDYQDYIYKSGDDWYLHKEVGKLDVLSSGIVAFSAHSGSHVTVDYRDSSIARLSTAAITNVSNRFIGCTATQTWDGTVINGVSQATGGNYLQFSLPSSAGATQAEIRTYFDNHPTTVYYALATPTDTKITDATLIAQLNALAKAKSYNDQTNIIVTTAGDNLPATFCVEIYRKSLSGVIEAIDNACTCGKEATHLVLSNPTTATWSGMGSVAIPYPSGAAVGMGTFVSPDVVFTKDDGTTMTVRDLYTSLTNGKSFEIDLPFGEINSACYRGSEYAAIVAAVENAKLDGSSKQTFPLGISSEMYVSSVPVMVRTSLSGYMLLDERFGVKYTTVDDGGTVTSDYLFVVDTYEEFAPPN